MLKLGLSLFELGQMKEGCAALAALPANIPMPRPPSRPEPRPSAPATSASNHPRDLPDAVFAGADASWHLSRGSAAALAVSGGGESVALMHLFADWAKRERAPLPAVLIVDHGSAAPNRARGGSHRAMGERRRFDRECLVLARQKTEANIEDRPAPRAIGYWVAWCAAQGVPHLFVAHTREDQAETFLLRLGRGSGVDGLSGMRAPAPLPVSGLWDGANCFGHCWKLGARNCAPICGPGRRLAGGPHE